MWRVLAFLALAAAPAASGDAPIRVRVVTFEGKPVTGARLEVRRSVTDRFSPMWPDAGAPTTEAWWEATAAGDDTLVATAVAGADGWAELGSLPVGAFDVTARVPGRAVRGAQVLSPPVRGAPPRTILLDAGHAIIGRIATREGAAISDALVVATFPAAGTARWEDRERPLVTRTDNTGAFRLEGVPSGPTVLRACPPETWFDRAHLVDVPRVEPVEIVLPLHTVNAIVRDERTGVPVAGATVFFQTVGFHMSSTLARATTDAKGRLRLGFPNRWLGRGEIHAPGYQPALLLASDDNDLERLHGRTLQIEAVPAASVAGAVRDPAGPVAFATVTATWLDGFETRSASARTREDGTFDVWVHEGLVHLAAARPGLRTEDESELDVLLATGGDGESGLVQVPATGRSGIRLDLPPVPGVGRVAGRLVTAQGAPTEGRVSGARTASDGTFEIHDVPAGRTRVFASAHSGRGTSHPVSVEAGKTTRGVDVLIASEDAVRVEGRVTGIDAHPGAYAIDGYSGRRHPVAPDGTFAFPVTASRVKLEVEVVAADGWAAHAEAKTDAGAVAKLGELALEAPPVRAFQVVAVKGGAPIRGATATRHRRLIAVGCGPFEPAVDFRSWREDEEGRLRIPIPRDGEWEIHVRADGFAGRDVPAKDVGDRLALWPLAVIGGRVRFGDGRPASGVRVEASGPLFSQAAYSRRQAITDGEGRFRIDGLAALDHYVLVESTAQGPSIGEVRMSDVAAPSEALEIVVEAARTIEGRAVDARGRPVADAEVRAEMSGDDAESTLVAQTDANGTFRLVGALAGKYDLYVSRDGLWTDGKAPDVAAGTRDVVIRAEIGLRIAGRVVDGEGRPRAGWLVSANNDRSYGEHRARTDADGRFVIDELDVGPWDLKLGRWAHRDPEGGAAVRAGTENLALVLR